MDRFHFSNGSICTVSQFHSGLYSDQGYGLLDRFIVILIIFVHLRQYSIQIEKKIKKIEKYIINLINNSTDTYIEK